MQSTTWCGVLLILAAAAAGGGAAAADYPDLVLERAADFQTHPMMVCFQTGYEISGSYGEDRGEGEAGQGWVIVNRPASRGAFYLSGEDSKGLAGIRFEDAATSFASAQYLDHEQSLSSFLDSDAAASRRRLMLFDRPLGETLGVHLDEDHGYVGSGRGCGVVGPGP